MKLSKNWLLQQAKQHKRALLLANLIALGATLISVPIPLLLPLMVDEVLMQQPAEGVAFFNHFLPTSLQKPASYIVLALLCIILMRVSSQALNILQTRQFTRISKGLTCNLRQQLLDKLGRVSMAQYEQKGAGGLTSHLVTDVETIGQFISISLSRYVLSLLTVIGTGAVLLWINWPLGLFIIVMNPVVIYLSRLLGNRVKHLKQRENQSFERFQTRLVETLDGLYQLRAANRESAFLDRLKVDATAIRDDANRFAWQTDAANRVSFLVFLLGFEVFRAAAMLMVLFSDLTIGQIFAVFGYLWFMLTPVQELLSIQYSWYGAEAAMKRLNSLFDLPEEFRPVATVDPFDPDVPFSVEFQDVEFGYDQEQRVLDGLSLTIPKGKRVALVGASGGGKSTLIQVLLGIYQKQSGEILINSKRIEEVSYAALRQNLAVVLQQPMIFNDSLRNNLTLGQEFTDDALWHALGVAQLSELKESLTEGLDSHLGRQGVRLSGGQRQRLAIARMVLSDPQLVILDEATSALDTQTEAKLHQALNTFLQNRTTLIVAHRLSAVKQADLIYVLEDGKVVQSGAHQKLIEEDGLYQTFYGRLLVG